MRVREPWFAALRVSIEACERQGYLQPWFVAQVSALIDVAEAAAVFERLPAPVFKDEHDDWREHKHRLSEALSKAADSQQEPKGGSTC